MKIVAELHAHTNVSAHAFNTLMEMCAAAEEKGLESIAFTNHTFGMIDSPTHMHFECYKYLPRKIGNVFIISGCEANIMDFDGSSLIMPTVLSAFAV